MAQLERPQRQIDTSKTPSTIHTMEQLLRAGEASKSKQSPTFSHSPSSSSSPSTPFFQRLRHHDSEEDHGQNQKKSVLTKVKEKAKKLRHSLSKKRHEDGNATSPSAGAGLESDGVEEEAAESEFLGPPMYGLERVPSGYKENTRHNARGSPVTSEKHVISNSDKHVVEQDQEKSLSRSLSKRITQPSTTTTTTTTTITTRTSPTDTINTTPNSLSGPSKTTNKTIAEKLTPIYVGESETARSIASKIQGLTASKPRELHEASSSTVTPATTHSTSLPIASPRTPPAKLPFQTCSSTPRTSSPPETPVTPAPSSASAAAPSEKNTSPTAQIWDKGVSVKEYLMNKLEPGEDEKALSKVISEAMSPRRTPGDAGVMEKVREAVTSLLRTEEPKKYADTTTTATASTSSQIPVSTNATHTSFQTASSARATPVSPQIPVSYNAHEVAEEENNGRILQEN